LQCEAYQFQVETIGQLYVPLMSSSIVGLAVSQCNMAQEQVVCAGEHHDWETAAELINLLKVIGVRIAIDGQDVCTYVRKWLSSAENLRACVSNERSNVVCTLLSVCQADVDVQMVVQTVIKRCV
jgi:hypothetical protein